MDKDIAIDAETSAPFPIDENRQVTMPRRLSEEAETRTEDACRLLSGASGSKETKIFRIK